MGLAVVWEDGAVVLAATGGSRRGLRPMLTKPPYRKRMSEDPATGNLRRPALKADGRRPRARKDVVAAQPPNERPGKHPWRTRKDCLVEIWPHAEQRRVEAPDWEAKALLEYLWERSPWAVQPQPLRTFQRRVKRWRRQPGPDQEGFFPQDWAAGRALPWDWTHADELAVTIAGQPYPHWRWHGVLPHANWEWATRCLSESWLSLRPGLQSGLHRLGKVPREWRGDHSRAAPHRVGAGGARSGSSTRRSGRCARITAWRPTPSGWAVPMRTATWNRATAI